VELKISSALIDLAGTYVKEDLERAAAADSANPLVREADHLIASGQPESKPAETLESNERNHILSTLEKTGWVIDGPHGAAKILAMHPNTLRSRMKKLGIDRA